MKSGKFILGILFLTLAIILMNCDKKPVEKLETAKTLINKMEIQETPKYAPEKYEMAMQYFEKANTLIENKNYKKATIQLNNCISTANAALVKTENEKELEQAREKSQSDSDVVYTDTTEQLLEAGEIEEPVAEEDLEPQFSEEKIHLVVTGDCLTEISMQYYGTSRHWEKIYEANAEILAGPNLIRTGQEIKIPAIELTPIIGVATAPQLKADQYLVEIGETLWSIANKVYPESTTNHWNLIYQKNSDKIVNPDFIYAGTILEIPSLSNYEFSPGDSTYLVKPGDNLWKIANILNETDTTGAYSWQELFELNQDILEDTNLVYPDQIIKLK